MEKNYKDTKNYSYKEKDDYTIVKNTKGGYTKLVQVGNVIISGSTTEKKYNSDVKKAFKELGY